MKLISMQNEGFSRSFITVNYSANNYYCYSNVLSIGVENCVCC